MSDRTLAQQANALVTKYVQLYKERYGRAPTVNRYRDKWGFTDMINDLGKGDADKVLAYYFSLSVDHSLIDLFRNYDELHKNRLADEEDQRRVAKLHEETAARVREHLKKWPQKN